MTARPSTVRIDFESRMDILEAIQAFVDRFATIGGLALATVATVLVLPAVYALLASKNAKEASLEPMND